MVGSPGTEQSAGAQFHAHALFLQERGQRAVVHYVGAPEAGDAGLVEGAPAYGHGPAPRLRKAGQGLHETHEEHTHGVDQGKRPVILGHHFVISGGEFRPAKGDRGHKAAQEVRRGLMRAVTESVDFHILSEGFHAGQGIVVLLTASLRLAGDHVSERGKIFLQTAGEIGSRLFIRCRDNDRLNSAGIALGKQ